MPNAFPSTILPAFIDLEAVLFGVFGFLYSVYALYSSLATSAEPARAPICDILRKFCRVLAVLLGFNALLVLYSLYLLGPTGGSNVILAGGLVVSLVVMVFISARMAFSHME